MRPVLFVAALAVAAAAPHAATAHAFARRYDLPLPLWLNLAGAGAAVAVSFVVLALASRPRPAATTYPRLDLRRFAIGRAVSHPFPVAVLQAGSVALFLLTLAAALFGNQDNPESNIAPTMVWIVWWVGFAFASALVGDVWRLLSPLRVLSVWAERLARRFDPAAGSLGLPLPGWLGVMPAVALFACFAWAELVWPSRAQSDSLGTAVLAYAFVTWTGMYLFGRDAWLRRGEAFTILFGFFARFAPLAARVSGPAVAACRGGHGEARESIGCDACWRAAPAPHRHLDMRPWGAGLLGGAVSWTEALFILIALATVTMDGLAETPLWVAAFRGLAESPFAPVLTVAGPAAARETFTTIGLVALPAAFIAAYAAVAAAMRLAAARGPAVGEVARRFILTLVPIAIAYHLAHFFSFLLISGQLIVPLASDPFGLGWDLLGTADYRIDLLIVGPGFVWYTAVIAIVVGHVAAVWLAHATALQTWTDRAAALRSQLPMLAAMVGYTMLSLWILAQPIVEL